MNKKISLGIVALLLVVSSWGCTLAKPEANTTTNPTTTITENTDLSKTFSYQNISAEELNNRLTSGKELLLIDVREPDELKGGYLPGAFNVPLGQLESRLKEIPRDKTVVVYCRSGRRSAEAANILIHNGYSKVVNLEGGIINWSYQVVKQQAAIDLLRVA